MDINQFWEALDNLSEELLRNAEDKLSLKTEGKNLEIRIDETFANVRFVRDILKALIRENRFTILPLTVQKLLADNFQQVSEAVVSGADDQDSIESLTQHVESAMTLIWQYHLQSIPDDYLDYARKQDNLKRVEEEFGRARSAMVSALTTAASLTESFTRSKNDEEELKKLLVSGGESVTKILEDVAKASTATADADAVLKKIKDANTEAIDFRAKAETAAAETKSLNDNIQTFYKEVSTYRSDMTAATAESREAISDGKEAVKTFLEASSKTANDTIKEFTDDTEAAKVKRQSELDELDTRMASKEARIDEGLLKVTGKSLFHSFDTRRKVLVISKWVWVGIIALTVAAAFGWAYHLSLIITQMDTAAYLKISATLPLVGFLWFALAQYAKERYFEEQYASRSNISVSLVPFRDEVIKLFDPQNPAGKEIAAFVLSAIDRVYEPIDGKGAELISETDKSKVADVLGSIPKGASEFMDKLTALIKVVK